MAAQAYRSKGQENAATLNNSVYSFLVLQWKNITPSNPHCNILDFRNKDYVKVLTHVFLNSTAYFKKWIRTSIDQVLLWAFMLLVKGNINILDISLMQPSRDTVTMSRHLAND